MRVFVGWSGTAGALIGNETVRYLNNLRGWVTAKPWTEFQHGVTVWEELLTYLSGVEAAILVASPQDPALQRGEAKTLPRDNIVLEYGLFTGALSRERVLLLVVGDPDLPTDMLGVNHAKLPMPADGEELGDNLRKQIQDEVCVFVKRTRCAQKAEVELKRAVCRAANANALLPDVFFKQCRPENYPTYTDEALAEAVRACTIFRPMKVGLETEPPQVHAYVDLSLAEEHQECLATRLADAVVEWLRETESRPSKIALLGQPELPQRPNVATLDPKQRVATRGLPVLEQAAGHLGYPVLFVDAQDGQVEIFGHVEANDNVVIMHDVVLSGQKPVRAACGLRDRGATAQHLFSLVANPQKSIDDLVGFLKRNNMELRYKMHTHATGAAP